MDHNIKGNSTSTSKAEYLLQIPTKHMPHHAVSLSVFKKAPLIFCPSVATFQGSSGYFYHVSSSSSALPSLKNKQPIEGKNYYLLHGSFIICFYFTS